MLHPSVDTVLLQCWGAENGERVPGWQKMLLKATMPLLKPFLAKVFKLGKNHLVFMGIHF